MSMKFIVVVLALLVCGCKAGQTRESLCVSADVFAKPESVGRGDLAARVEYRVEIIR